MATKAEQKFDVMLTRQCFIPGEDGQMVIVGPEVEKETRQGTAVRQRRFGKPVRVTVSRRLGNQIVQANRGYWADGEPPPGHVRETATEPAAEKAVPAPKAGAKK